LGRKSGERRKLGKRIGAANRAAGFLDQRVGWLHVIAARSVPDRLIEDDGKAKRVGRASDNVGQPDAAEPFIADAVAGGVDHDARGSDLVQIRSWPQLRRLHRVAAVDVTVDVVHPLGERSAERLRELYAVTDRGAAVARQ